MVLQIATEQYSSKLTPTDFLILAQQIVSATGPTDPVDLFQLLNVSIFNGSESLKVDTSFAALCIVLQSKNNDVIIESLSMIRALHQVSSWGNLNDHIEVVLHQFKYYDRAETILPRLSSFVQMELGAVFPLCAYIAVCAGHQPFAHLIHTVPPSEQYCSSHCWSLWSLYGAIVFNECSTFIFLIRCRPTDYKDLFVTLDRLCEILGRDSDSFQHEFLIVLTGLVLSGEIPSSTLYFDLLWFHMFMSRRKPLSRFSETTEKSPDSKKRFRLAQTNYRHISRLLTEASVPDPSECYSRIRIDENGHWLDFELAKAVVLCCTQQILPGYIDFYCAILYFIAREDPSVSQSLLPNVIGKASATLAGSVAMLINKSPKRSDFRAFTRFLEQTKPEIIQISIDSLTSIQAHTTRIIELHKSIFSDLQNAAITQITKTAVIYTRTRIAVFRHWKLIWSHLTVEGCPWAKRFPSGSLKRDFQGSVLFCPLRTKLPPSLHNHPQYPVDIEILGSDTRRCRKVTVSKVKDIIWGFLKPSKKKLTLGTHIYRCSQIRFLFLRGNNAIEIHFFDGYSVLLDGVDGLADAIANSAAKQRKGIDIQTATGDLFLQSLGHTQTWTVGKMSNFEYLIWLNMIAGRSFHDLSRYPIFPCVLADFTSSSLDLENKTVFRDLSQPVAIQKLNIPGILCRLEPFTEMNTQGQSLNSIPEFLVEIGTLIPEFYFMPEFLMSTRESQKNVELPCWAKSAIDFVYLHRKALEKVDLLNVWIDQIFGCELRERKESITQLFLSPHPKKELVSHSSILQKQITLKLPSEQYLFGSAEQFVKDRLKIQIVAVDLTLAVDRLTLIFTPGSDQISQKLLPKESLNLPEFVYSFFKLNSSVFVALPKHGLGAEVINHRGGIRSTRISSNGCPVTAISGSNNTLLLSLKDGITQRWRVHQDHRLLFSFPSYRSGIRCSFTSNPFHLVVIGTNDSWLVINSLFDGKTIRSVKLDCIPLKVLITPLWGFILVHGCEYENEEPFYSLILLNINGLFIRKVQFAALIKDWFAWTSVEGFDFVILSAEKGRLFAFEVFFLEVGSPVHRFTSEVVGLYFASSINFIIALEADGTLHFIPFTTKSIERYG
jgi:hypothetical protein